jgi:hypothetical protein
VWRCCSCVALLFLCGVVVLVWRCCSCVALLFLCGVVVDDGVVALKQVLKDMYMLQKGTKAPQAAGVIHSDMMNGFICAEIMKYVDYKELQSEAACRAAGKHRQLGKEYVVEDGDIIFFKVNLLCFLSTKIYLSFRSSMPLG